MSCAGQLGPAFLPQHATGHEDLLFVGSVTWANGPCGLFNMPTATGAAEELHFHGKVFARLHVLRQEDLTSSAGPHSLNLRFCKRKPYGVVW